MKETIKFSVLIPVYDAEEFLCSCLESVLSQSYSNFELIVVDDGSKDLSGSICDEYATKDYRIKVVHKKNEGALAARVTGLTYASGDYFVFLDADDTLVEYALETIFKKIQETDADCIIYPFNIVKEEKIVDRSCDAGRYGFMTNKREIYTKLFSNQSFNSMCCKAVKNTLVEKVDYSTFYYIAHGEDLLQSLEILKNAKSVYFLDLPLYNYRMNPNSVTHTWNYENCEIDYTVFEKALAFLKSENVFTKEDFVNYRILCIDFLANQLRKIAHFDTSKNNKISLYRQIKESKYYREFLSCSIKDEIKKLSFKNRICISLFYKGKYKSLLTLISFWNSIRKR